MKKQNSIVLSILAVGLSLAFSGCDLLFPQDGIVEVTITNSAGGYTGPVVLLYGDMDEQPEGEEYLTPLSYPYVYEITDYTPGAGFVVMLVYAGGSVGEIIRAPETGTKKVTLDIDSTEEITPPNYSAWTGPSALSGGASLAEATEMPLLSHWYTDTLSSNEEKWFKVSVLSGQEYVVAWDDSFDGSDLYTSDVVVGVYDSMGSLYASEDDGYSSPLVVTPSESELFIKVDATWGAGTLALGVTSLVEFMGNETSPRAHQPLDQVKSWYKKK